MYVIRAYNYYQLLVSLGDLPIVTTALPDIKEDLMEASKRQPRHKVAEFILKDLQTAIDTYLLETPPGGKTRISRDVALLLRARVALFEGTWENIMPVLLSCPMATDGRAIRSWQQITIPPSLSSIS